MYICVCIYIYIYNSYTYIYIYTEPLGALAAALAGSDAKQVGAGV